MNGDQILKTGTKSVLHGVSNRNVGSMLWDLILRLATEHFLKSPV